MQDMQDKLDRAVQATNSKLEFQIRPLQAWPRTVHTRTLACTGVCVCARALAGKHAQTRARTNLAHSNARAYKPHPPAHPPARG
jgi:hypothetical protein